MKRPSENLICNESKVPRCAVVINGLEFTDEMLGRLPVLRDLVDSVAPTQTITLKEGSAFLELAWDYARTDHMDYVLPPDKEDGGEARRALDFYGVDGTNDMLTARALKRRQYMALTMTFLNNTAYSHPPCGSHTLTLFIPPGFIFPEALPKVFPKEPDLREFYDRIRGPYKEDEKFRTAADLAKWFSSMAVWGCRDILLFKAVVDDLVRDCPAVVLHKETYTRCGVTVTVCKGGGGGSTTEIYIDEDYRIKDAGYVAQNRIPEGFMVVEWHHIYTAGWHHIYIADF